VASGGAWLKYGCLGCLGVVVLVLVGVGGAIGVALVTTEPEQVESHVLTPEIPLEIAAGGRVILEARQAELYVEPAEPGEPLRVEAHYDTNAFALEEEFDPATEEDGAWTYRMTFGRGDRSGALSGLVSMFRRSTARIHVFLPRDVPIDLTLDAETGAAIVRLGGLWLRTAEVRLETGALDLSFDEPLREPMESLKIRSVMGGALLNRIGNASPRRLDVNYNMGGIDMDLGGLWLRDAEINIIGRMGGGAVHLPEGVTIEGLDHGNIEAPMEPELKRPTLKFSVSSRMGQIEFH